MTVDREFESFLTYLSASRGFDFTAYKRPTLSRRVQKRMQDVRAESYSDYTEYLETHPDEFTALFNTILINVTSFMRDAPAWDFVARDVIPKIVERKLPDDPIRVWSAGCASGEEAYTLAILFAEALGVDAYSRRVKIYGTDIDDDALHTARRAVYPAKALTPVPPALRDRYFERVNGGDYAFRKDLRRNVIFGRIDLLQDAPISRVDLLVCRNTLMYFNADAQAQVISRFIFALTDGGYLFLGKAETLLPHTSMITPVDLRLRVFRKTGRPGRERPLAVPGEALYAADAAASTATLREIAFETDPSPQLTVDATGALVGANARAQRAFGLRKSDIGRPIDELDVFYRPVDLKSLIAQAHKERRNIVAVEVEWPAAGGATRWYSVTIYPLWVDSDATMGVNVVFTDISRHKEMETDLQRSRDELQAANQELQSANEEMETTNEELQSTVEELETTNEELQSTNEELETMNEELHSTNEELETVNVQLRESLDEVDRLNAFFESVLSSLRPGIIVLDRGLVVLAWNSASQELWGVQREEAIGTNLMNLDIGLPVSDLADTLRRCVDAGEVASLRLQARNRRGRDIVCDVSCMPLQSDGATGGVIVLVDAEEDR